MRLLALLAALPLAAHADLIYVDYDGVVTGSSGNYQSAAYTLGQRVQGRLTIDTEKAPPPVLGPDSASYEYCCKEPGPDFVTGFLAVNPSRLGSDIVTFELNSPDGAGGTREIFRVADDNGGFGRGQGIDLWAIGHGFLDGVDFNQSFDIKASNVTGPRASLFGTILESTDEFVTLTLSRLSVKPGRCFAT